MTRCLSYLAALLFVVLSGCTRPYITPNIEEPGQEVVGSFHGLRDFMSPSSPAKVLWTHGMCTHGFDWVTKRADLVAQALQAQTKQPIPRSGQPDTGQPYTVDVSYVTSQGELDVAFFVWSPLTQPFKKNLLFDKSGTNPTTSFPYHRASFNEQLKAGLMNDCLADAVIYGGPNGASIRAAMQGAVCHTLGGRMSAGQGCVVTGNDQQPVIFVTESLGSKFLFDAVRELWRQSEKRSNRERLALARRMASVSMLFMAANQIPLLDQASASPSEKSRSGYFSSLAAMETVLAQARALAGMQSPSGASLSDPRPLTVVGFTDPNDLLSYRLLPGSLGISQARLINYIVSNDITYFDLIERPDTAHCGYSWNPYVIGAIVNGYTQGHTLSSISVPATQGASCF